MYKTFALAFIVALAVPLSASAQPQNDKPAIKAANVNSIPSSSTTDIKTRSDERKARLKTKLDAATQKNISGKCVSAQAKLKMVSAKLRQTNENYLPKYEAFILKSEKLELSLSNSGVKSTDLLNQIGQAKLKYEAVKTAATALQASVDDASELDCKADPTSFKAAVDDARLQSKALTDAKQDLTKYARTTLKSTLQAIKAN